MKKVFQLTVLSFILSISILAGDYPGGGRTCQPTPTTPCPTMVSQNETPKIDWREYIVIMIKTIRLF
jgi:hypothetical protein